MKVPAPNKLALRLGEYFTNHLPRVRGMSAHTIHSYRDSVVLFLRFLASQRSRGHDLDLDDIEPDHVIAFLTHLEEVRKNGVTTRNVRLAAIHAFFDMWEPIILNNSTGSSAFWAFPSSALASA